MIVFGIITLIGIIILCTAAAYQVLNNVSVKGRFWPSVVGVTFIVFSIFSVGVLPAGLSAIPLVMSLAAGIALAIVLYNRRPPEKEKPVVNEEKKEETAAADAAPAADLTDPEKKEEVPAPEGKKGKKGKKAQEPALPAAAAEPQKA